MRWAIVIYDSQRNFPQWAYTGMVDGFLKACDDVGQFSNLDAYYLDTYRPIFSLVYRYDGGKS